LPCATGQMHWRGAPPVRKGGELDAHTHPARALARRAHTVEEKGGKAMMAWRKGPSLFFDGAEQAMDVWASQVWLLYSKPMAGRQ
jgi:hypothetical protein